MNFKPFSLLESITYNLDTDKQATKTHGPGTVDDPKIRGLKQLKTFLSDAGQPEVNVLHSWVVVFHDE